ncbi:MAG: SMC-Scp complex subunit ScpB [Acidimicrobiales bacterium]
MRGGAGDIGPAIEAILMVSAEPVPAQLLAELLETAVEEVEAEAQRLRADYEAQGRGFILAKVAGGYRYQSHPDQAAFVERFATDGGPSRLSPAALETLAIVAYLQPVSRAQISAIRGVGVDGVVRMLCQRGYVVAVGRDPGPGQAVLFGTTDNFLERMGLDEITSLPPLGDFVPGAEVMASLEEGLSER